MTNDKTFVPHKGANTMPDILTPEQMDHIANDVDILASCLDSIKERCGEDIKRYNVSANLAIAAMAHKLIKRFGLCDTKICKRQMHNLLVDVLLP